LSFTLCYVFLETTNNLEGEGEDEGVHQVVDGLENGDVLHEGAVPHETEEESADEHDKHEDEKLHERVRLVLSLGNFLNHLLCTDIFFWVHYK